ncbi:MAG: hypothetical protein Q7R35_15015 [Elusimicrobiota bacterium]|nr:hypothetical protein [Elusimicrobiota bacterium]
MTGDITIDNTGLSAIGANKVTFAKMGLNGCTDNQIMKMNVGGTAWVCAADDGAGSAVTLGPSSPQADTSGNDSIAINHTGVGNLLRLQKGGVDKFIVDNAGAISTISGITASTITLTDTVAPFLIKPSGAPSANAKLFDMQATGAGVTNFSVDAEGDAIANSLAVDTIGEKTAAAGVTIDGVLLKDNALSGVTTIGLSGAITGPTTVNTLNSLIVNSGALSGITGYTQASGAMAFSGGGNFSLDSAAFDVTTAGAISGVTTLGMSGVLTNSNAAAAAITLSGNAAGITFTGAAVNPNTIVTSNNNHLALMPNGTGKVGIGTTNPGAMLDLGIAGNPGVMRLAGTTSGNVTVKTADAAGTWALTLPIDAGTDGQTLKTDGAGVTSWAGPAWYGKIAAAAMNGDPDRVLRQMIGGGNVAPTPTNIGIAIARCSSFVLPADLTVNTIRYYGVGGTTNVFRVAIYRYSDLVRLTAELPFTTVANTWGNVATGGVTLYANTRYFVAVSVNATGTVAGPAAMGGTTAATTGSIQTTPTNLPGNLSFSSGYINSFEFQFAVTSGALPDPAATLAAHAAAWTGGMPAFFLDNQ